MKIPQIFLFLSGDPENFSLEKRIFHFTIALAIVMALVAVLENIGLGMPLPLTLLMLAYMAIMMMLYALSRFMDQFQLSRIAACLLLILLFAPAEWIMNGGTDGGAHYTFLFYGMALCAVCSGKQRNVFLALLVLVIVGLGLFEYYRPENIMYCEDRAIRYIDVMSSFIITIVLTVILFLSYLKDYDHERSRVMEYSELLEQMAITDGLTSVFNHSYIYQLLEDKIKESMRYDSKLSAVMFDLDHFKVVNDTFGHEFGNTVLVEVTNILKQNIRESDVLGRYGGEEFLLVCPGIHLGEAVQAAERLRKEVENITFTNGFKITISGGVAEFGAWMPDPAATLIHHADDALYQAKRTGRNKIIAYAQPAERMAADQGTNGDQNPAK